MSRPFGPPRNGIKGMDYSVAVRGRLLRDCDIQRYALRGFYGPTTQAAEERALQERKAARRTRKPSIMSALLSELASL